VTAADTRSDAAPAVSAAPSRAERPGLRIALATETDRNGGAETMMVHLARALRERGHEVHLIGPADGCGWLGGEMRAHGFATHEFHMRGPLDPACLRELAGLLRRERIDVLHAHLWVLAVYGTAAARLVGIPSVITMHGDAGEVRYLRRRVTLRWAFRKSAGVVMVSRSLQDHFTAGLGVRGDDWRIIPNGVPERVGTRDALRRELAVRDDELLVCSVGNLYPVKGHDVLLAALAELPRELPWRVAIAGRPEDNEPVLRAAIARHGWQDRVHLLGSRSDVPDVLAAADVFCHPSRAEALPLAVLEAMFAGRAIVASRVGGIPEVARDEQEALLVPPEDPTALASALRRVLTDASLRASLGARARERARVHYAVPAMADAYEALYRQATQ
jgi:glycosyltransferase involved in cell wall biosynthesis